MFLRDLRRLRAQGGLSLDELAARAGFPAGELAATETGPGLPSLPALEAYLRGCGEPLAAWEDRWRRLTQGGTGADGGLPTRDPGTSPLAVAGAAAVLAAPASPAQQADPGEPPGAAGAARRRGFSRRRSVAAVGAAVALIAAGGIAFGSLSGTETRPPGGPEAPPRGAPAPGRAAPPGHGQPAPGRSGGRLDVAGVGCPEDSQVAVVLADAPTGPGWTAAGGGWTGNGCDGSAVWTFNPNGNQPVPSALTWKFVPAPGTSRCTLSVFVPAQNALGASEYDIFSASQMIATVRIWQGASAGQWVTLGSYLNSGAFGIRLIPEMSPVTGPDRGPHGHRHVVQAPGENSAIAASAASAACTLGLVG